MSAKNSILLTIMQSPGIDYNSLLNKCSANYSNINSARAALSRALKDFSVFGFVRKQDNRFFATDKAVVVASAEMKNKLVMKLNQAISSKNPVLEIDTILQRLSTLAERARHDPDLLKTAKTSVDFYVSDLKQIEEKLNSEVNHLSYLAGVLNSNISALSELDFNDMKKTDAFAAQKIVEKIIEKTSQNEVIIETANPLIVEKFEAQMQQKFKKTSLALSQNDVEKFFGLLESLSEQEKKEVSIFLPPIKISFAKDTVFFSGPFSSISAL